MTQARIAETEKYAHVTFFFNGGVEEPNKGEDRILVKSPKVATYYVLLTCTAPIIMRSSCSRPLNGSRPTACSFWETCSTTAPATTCPGITPPKGDSAAEQPCAQAAVCAATATPRWTRWCSISRYWQTTPCCRWGSGWSTLPTAMCST